MHKNFPAEAQVTEEEVTSQETEGIVETAFTAWSLENTRFWRRNIAKESTEAGKSSSKGWIDELRL